MSALYRAPDGTTFHSREAIEEQYDLDRSVPSFPAYLERYIAESARARDEYKVERGLSYGPTRAETLDVFPGLEGGPIVVFLHGGYWVALTSDEHSYIAPGFLASGATVVVPTYALCPAVTIDEIVRQARASIAWAYRNGSRYSADTSRLVVVGHSAGGHLVAQALDTNWSGDYGLPDSIISGACAISGLFDLRPFPYTSMQADMQFTADQVLRNSPILNPPSEAPHLLLTFGSEQPRELLRQSRDFHAVWRAAGLPGELWERPGWNHFDELDDLGRPGSELVRRILALADPR